MRKNQQSLQVAENTPNKVSTIILTSDRHPHYDSVNQMEQMIEKRKRKDTRKAAYPLRFKNKTQKESLERAARKQGKSLRAFILFHAEQAAQQLEVKAS